PDGDEAIVPDRAPAGGGDGVWRRLLHADDVLFRPQPDGHAAEEARDAVYGTSALGSGLINPILQAPLAERPLRSEGDRIVASSRNDRPYRQWRRDRWLVQHAPGCHRS